MTGKHFTTYFSSPISITLLVILLTTRLAPDVGASGSSYQANSNDQGNNFSPPSYQFRYGVYDDQNGNDFGHQEERQGHSTKGEYRVMLPDGRLQIVRYTADENGYKADVTYEKSGGYSSSSGSVGSSSSSNSGYGQQQQASQISSSYGVPPVQQPQRQRQATDSTFNSRRSFSTLSTKINGRTYGY